MDLDMEPDLWDESQFPIDDLRGPRSSQQVSQNYLAMGSGIGSDAANVPYDAQSLETDIDAASSLRHHDSSIPGHRPVFEPRSMANFADSSFAPMFNTDRQGHASLQELRQQDSEYMTSQDTSDVFSIPGAHGKGARSVDTTSPTTSHRGLHINGDFTPIESGASLSSSPNFGLESRLQDRFLNVNELSASHFRQRDFGSRSPAPDMPYAFPNLGDSVSRPVSRGPCNPRVQTQGLDELIYNNQPTLALSAPVEDSTTRQNMWEMALPESTGNFDWANSQDAVSVSSSPLMMNCADFGLVQRRHLPDFGPHVISPTKNIFNASDLNCGHFEIISDYAPSEATSTATTEAYTVPSESQYLKVPSPPHRRQSDPQPLREETAIHLARTRSTHSPKYAISPRATSRNRGSSAASRTPGSQVGPQMNHVELPSAPQRGRRQGPMGEEKRRAIRDKRVAKTTCVRCKIAKISCDPVEGSDACAKCQNVKLSGNKPYVCTKAYFMELVLAGPTNYISQHSINHLRRGHVNRRRLPVPESVNFEELMSVIESLSSEYNIRVSQGAVALYDIDLLPCHDYLDILRRTLPQKCSFRRFIDMQLQRDDEWRACIKDQEPLEDLLAVLSVWNNMPSRVTYSLVGKHGGYERALDPDSLDDQPIIYAAAQISRMISRKLELAAYYSLQQELNNAPTSPLVVTRLANLLLSLRWRISWWTVLGSGVNPAYAAAEQEDLSKFVDRVTKLCSILYFYYCWMRRVVSGYAMDAPPGKTSRYADTQCEVTERFPEDESLEGFSKWMEDGRAKILEAKAAKQLEVVGLA